MSKPNGASRAPNLTYVRLSTLLTIVPMSASSVWRGVRSQKFPAPVKLGPRITAWKLSAIEAYLAEREAQ
ncbi:MAG: AlpA family phage regulatory protein [Burkholderiales bacterium]